MGERVGVRKITSEKERKKRERRERPMKRKRQERLICLIDNMTTFYWLT